MGVFSYIIVKDNNEASGIVNAKNIDEARELLLKTGANILSLHQKFFSLQSSTKLSRKELIYFFSSMASMDKVGVDVLKALQLMKDEIALNAKMKKVCTKIYDFVGNGSSFSDACKQASPSFTNDFVGLINVAEQTGQFASVFEQLVAYIKWNDDIRRRAKKAIRGPIFTLIFLVVMIVAMSVLMLPKVVEFITYFNYDPPFYTLALIAFSDFVRTKWYVICGLIVGFIIFTKVISKVNYGIACVIDRFKLHIPIFGQLILKLDTSRFISFFSLMYNSGAEMLNIIESISHILSNKYLQKCTKNIKYNILNGESIFAAIDKEKVFPNMFRKMMAICETTGEVGPVLENVRYFYDKETAETTDKVVGTIKPVTTILLGGVIAWMGVGMLGPIYTNIGSMGDIGSTAKDV